MSLILAVEPDRRQASHITAMVRRLHAELVLADSAIAALGTLGDRVPDLILTSALLSAKDEAALAARVRELGPDAAHVQELTIPILAQAAAAPARAKKGVLSTLRRTRKSSSPDGCEPDVFAAQVVLYLERAAAERHALQPEIDVVAEPVDAVNEPVDDDVTLELLLLPPTEATAGSIDDEVIDPEPAMATGMELSLAFDFENVPEIEAITEEPPVTAAEEPVVAAREEPPVAAVEEPALVSAATPLAPSEDVEPWVPIALDEEPDGPMPIATNVWVLTPVIDIDEVLASVAPEPPRIVAPPPPPPAVKKKGGKTKKKPVQDEWGFFDPDQCGFAALVAKLDEITEEADQSADTTVRVIGY